MKSCIVTFPQHIIRFSLWALILANAAVLSWNCEKDSSQTENPTVSTGRPDAPQATDPQDVISFVDPREKALYVDPEYFPTVMNLLNARPIGPERFLLSGKSFLGSQVEFAVHVIFMSPPAIAEVADVKISLLNDTHPDVILSGIDSLTGVPIRVRRNWECGRELAAFTSPCLDSDKGTSSHIQYLKTKICQKKDGALCPEEYGIWGIKYKYSTKGCTGTPVNIEPERYWVCK